MYEILPTPLGPAEKAVQEYKIPTMHTTLRSNNLFMLHPFHYSSAHLSEISQLMISSQFERLEL